MVQKVNGNPAESKFDMQKLLAPAVMVIMIIFFVIMVPNLRTASGATDALLNVLNASYFIGFMALGVTFVIITGGIDLSLGTTMMCGMLIGGLSLSWGLNTWMALLIGVCVCTFIGLLNGLMIAYLKLPPFIATLGTQMMGMGFGAIVTKVTTMRFTDQGFKRVFYKMGNDMPAPFTSFPIGIVWLILAFILAWVLLNKTKFGRYTFAMGSNYEAARLSGIKTKYWLTLVYTLCGFFCGLAGIFYSAVYTTIIPSTGNGLELLAIAGVVIGGTSMAGGTGSLTGTLIGVFTMSILKQGLMLMNLQGQWQTFMTGAVVVGAVLLDQYRVRQANKVRRL
ncbi:ABC transporter permease [Eubacteriales bacterium OttesenSCG-928-N13]|nr:ABC transporter permease [Eubacteriales bacterium OttesenSCG-928-N13]